MGLAGHFLIHIKEVALLQISQSAQIWAANRIQRSFLVLPLKQWKMAKVSAKLVEFQETPNIDLTPLHRNWASGQLKKMWLTSLGWAHSTQFPLDGPWHFLIC
jgi:hypothetical protein